MPRPNKRGGRGLRDGRRREGGPGRALASVMKTPSKKRGGATKSIYGGMDSRRLCLCVGDPATCFGAPYGLPTAFPNSPTKDRGTGYSMLRKKKGGGKKHLSPERSVNPKKKLSPIQQLQLQDQQHAQVSQVAPSGRVAGPTPVAGFQSRDILTPYAPLSSLNPDGRHESRRRGQAQQVFSNEIKLQQMIDQMHNSSIQDLPWQARACPQALETKGKISVELANEGGREATSGLPEREKKSPGLATARAIPGNGSGRTGGSPHRGRRDCCTTPGTTCGLEGATTYEIL